MGLDNPKISVILTLITAATALGFGIALFFSKASIYGAVVHTETSEWDLGAIQDIISAD
jgi:hypothetical protein